MGDNITAEPQAKQKRRRKRFNKKPLIIIICVIAVAAAAAWLISKKVSNGNKETEYETVKVERRDIIRTIEASSTVEANDTYDVTALVTGEILSDTFNEGDTVIKDQLLYTIDSEDAQRSVDTARNSLTKAQQNFADEVRKKMNTLSSNSNNEKNTRNAVSKALENVASANRTLDTARGDLSDLTIKSDLTGTVSEVFVKVGDSVIDGSKLAMVYDDSSLKIQIPFNESDAEYIGVGDTATLLIGSSGDKLTGTVDSIAGATTATSAHAIVRYITIKVTNPGGLKAGEKASAAINGVSCSDLGTFENYDEGYITARANGRISEIYLEVNDHITSGQVVGYIESDNVTNTYENAKASVRTSQLDLDDAYTKLQQLVIDSDTYALDSAIKSAELSLDDARIALENANKKLEDYEITAPIDGTIITKNKKTGDKLEQNTAGASEPMAVIYDMSVLKVSLDIDESDIQDMMVGQSVSVTADAAEGMFEGEITKVGVNGTSENGVTVYPVEVTIEEYGDLLPGMNVDCVVEVENAKNVLAVPAASIQRGNKVYVKGEKTEDNDRAPDGYHSVEVVTGTTDSFFIEIKKGLNEGQEILGTVKASGTEAEGNTSGQPQMGGMPRGGMGGGMSGGGMGGPPGGGMGGNRGGMSGGMR